MSRFTFHLLCLWLTALLASAKTVSYEWEVSWLNAAPDGFARPVIGVNGNWPCPTIEADLGDTIEVKLTNKLGNQTTGIHFHGIRQISTNFMDGASLVTQCPIPPNSTMTYRFTADIAGSFWWHSHNMGQYPDGLRGPMIVHDPDDPYTGCYDEEYTMTVSDWYHEQSIPLAREMFSPNNTDHFPPFPDSPLINDGQDAEYEFVSGTIYRFRIISFAAFAAFMIHFDSHDMHVIAIDGSYVTETPASTIRVAAGQRYDVLLRAGSADEERNFAFLAALDQNPDWRVAALGWDLNATGQLVMLPDSPFTELVVDAWDPYDDSTLEPLTGDILPAASVTIELDFTNCFDDEGIPRSCFNGSPYIEQKVPSLYTAATVGDDNTNPTVYGPVHPYIIASGDTVDIVLNNFDAAIHPFHLHGHHFQILARPDRNTGTWPGSENATINENPPTRDTIHVEANSYAVVRYRANNPGVYLFHCHIEWHVEMGLSITIIEGPETLRGLELPEDHLDICRRMQIPTSGNAAGNLDDPLDTSDFNLAPPLEYKGAAYEPPSQTTQFRRRLVHGRGKDDEGIVNP